ncbi:benenodin family lasso peptide [Hephaestia sp. GCM10023244]|nr:benenodin family lasso peptide [Hephaestia sp. MAHUQ-44]MCM8732420.1 benenodin family lasso peptide [Hephaestia sp. MAHUQ-44]
MKLIHEVIDLGAASAETHGNAIGDTDEVLGRDPFGLSRD